MSQNTIRNREKENEYAQLQIEIEKTRERERKAVVENENLRNEVRKLEHVIATGTRNVENLNRTKEELLNEIKEIQNRLAQVSADRQE